MAEHSQHEDSAPCRQNPAHSREPLSICCSLRYCYRCHPFAITHHTIKTSISTTMISLSTTAGWKIASCGKAHPGHPMQFPRRKPKSPRMRLAMKRNQALNPVDGRTFVPRTSKGLMRRLLIVFLTGQAVEIVPRSAYWRGAFCPRIINRLVR